MNPNVPLLVYCWSQGRGAVLGELLLGRGIRRSRVLFSGRRIAEALTTYGVFLSPRQDLSSTLRSFALPSARRL
jgi:hypothetical protein